MEITLPHLEPWQKDLLYTYLENPTNNIITVKAPRQVGKSIAIEILLIYVSLSKKGVSMCVSPTINQCRKIYTDITHILEGIPCLKKKNDTLLQLEFTNGSVIYFKSAEMRDGLRGYTVSNLMVIDEASFIGETVVYELLLPMTNVHKCTVILTSTPKFKQGVFYDCYLKGIEGKEGFISLDWCKYDLSTFLTPEKLNIYQSTLPKRVFQSEYLGMFIDGDSALFANFTECIKDDISFTGDIYFGIDWATGSGNDSTVISIGGMNNKIKLLAQYAYTDKSTQETIKAIMKLVEKYQPKGIAVEKNSIGNLFYDLLKEAVEEYVEQWNYTHSWNEKIDIEVKAITTTNKSKQQWVDNLALLFEQNEIEIPNCTELIKQLTFYECKVNQNGTATFNAKTGYHDDYVMSLFMLLTLIQNQSYEIY